jgi:hypothetical protein
MKKARTKKPQRSKTPRVTKPSEVFNPKGAPSPLGRPASSLKTAISENEAGENRNRSQSRRGFGMGPTYFPYALGGCAIILAALGGYFVGARPTLTTNTSEVKEEGVRDPSTTLPAADAIRPDYSEPGLDRFQDHVQVSENFWKTFLDDDGSEAFFKDTETEPYTLEGELQGMKIKKLDKTSLISKIGLKEGDVLEAVNDIPFTDAETILEDLRSKREMTKVIFHGLRSGKPFDTVLEIH